MPCSMCNILISHKQTHTYGSDVSSEIPYQMGEFNRLALVPFSFVAVEANGRPSLPQDQTREKSHKSRGGGGKEKGPVWSPAVCLCPCQNKQHQRQKVKKKEASVLNAGVDLTAMHGRRFEGHFGHSTKLARTFSEKKISHASSTK